MLPRTFVFSVMTTRCGPDTSWMRPKIPWIDLRSLKLPSMAEAESDGRAVTRMECETLEEWRKKLIRFFVIFFISYLSMRRISSGASCGHSTTILSRETERSISPNRPILDASLIKLFELNLFKVDFQTSQMAVFELLTRSSFK